MAVKDKGRERLVIERIYFSFAVRFVIERHRPVHCRKCAGFFVRVRVVVLT